MKQLFIIIGICLIVMGAEATTLKLVTLESPPAEFSLDGKSTGRNVDISMECLKRMGFQSNVLIVPWQRAIIMVKHGTADGIIDAAYNTERSGFLYYPDEEIYVEEWYAFKRKDDAVTFDKGLANVGQYALGISRGFEYGGLIQEAINNRRFKKIEEVANNEMNISKLIVQRFDVFVGVKLTILNLSKKMGYSDQIEIVKMTETKKPYLLSSSKTYVAFSKQTMTQDIAQLFSDTLKEMKADGTVIRIEQKYY
ncbi:MAG: transporter substrate-binding domain-containing protein [Desulfobacteraceae bacterium]|nr:transporter substrate-binding domain-containing protein [Desulfobacteraceae bacterium]